MTTPRRLAGHPSPALPDLSIRQLEYLVAVDETPTWAAAAQRVGVSPSALSQGLAELERRLGIDMFDRGGRRRLIRSSAEPVVAHARHVLGLTSDLAWWAERLRHGSAGRVRLGMIDAAAIVHFPDQLQVFRSDRPDVELLLRVSPSAQLIDQLVGGGLDLVLCVEPPSPIVGVEIEPLMLEDLTVYGPPDRTIGDPPTGGPWVLFPDGSHTRNLVESALRSLGAPLDVVTESHQPEVLREMVRLGAGWTVLPTSQAEHGDRGLSNGRLLTSRRLVIARRSGSVHDPAADELASRFRRAADRAGP